jgi:hypothetical protein
VFGLLDMLLALERIKMTVNLQRFELAIVAVKQSVKMNRN